MFSKSFCCLILNFNLRSEVQKSWFYLGKMQFFTKKTFLLWSGHWWKTWKKTAKNCFEIKLFFHIDFSWILEPTLMDFGLQVEAGPRVPPRHFFQVAAKRRPRGAQGAPRASQGRLKSLQEPPKRAPRVPKSDQNVPRARPRCLQRVTFLRNSLFFNFFRVFLHGFSCVFLCFFTAYPR